MKSVRRLFFIGAFHLCSLLSFAFDSPLTSCFFATAYRDQPEIERILQLVKKENRAVDLDSATAHYLLRSDIDLGIRMAVVNALRFGVKNNIDVTLQAVARQYAGDVALFRQWMVENKWEALSKEFVRLGVGNTERMVIAYVFAMADYSDQRLALTILSGVQDVLIQHEVGYWIAMLIASQTIMETEPCNVFLMFAEADAKKFEVSSWRNEAKVMIMDYIALYELACLPDEYSDDYYLLKPVFDTTQTKQIYSPAKYVDLQFVGANAGELDMNVFTDNESDEGGYVLMEVKNNGNTHSIPTNVYCEMQIKTEEGEDRFVRQALVPGIGPRKSEIVRIFLPGVWWQKGVGTMELRLDQANQIEESDEANNSVRMSE